jgi:glutamate-1-semialdehyde 2,1-aminomutase
MTDANASFRERAQRLIPAGCHTYPKGEDQYPENAPAYLVRGKGCRVWDGKGNAYIEYGMGLRAVILGHAYEAVVSGRQACAETVELKPMARGGRDRC